MQMNMDANLLSRISKESNDSNRIPPITKNKYNIAKSQNDYNVGTTVAPRKSIYLTKKQSHNLSPDKGKEYALKGDKLEKSQSFNKYKKKDFNFNFEKIEKSTDQMISFFLDRYPFQNRVSRFLETYPRTETILDLFRVIIDFPDFNFFDYMKLPVSKFNENEESILRHYYIKRNNYFICVMIELWKYNKDISPLQKHIETFIKLNNENLTKIEIEADFFFLVLFGLREKAVSFLIKYNNYFKNIFKDFRELDPLKDFKYLRLDIDFFEMGLEEIWIIRKIIRSIIVRSHIEGLEFLLSYKNDIQYFIMEGAIWKDVVLQFDSDEVWYIWSLYQSKFKEDSEKYYVESIHLSHDPEYANGLKVLMEEIKKNNTLGKPNKEEDIRKVEMIDLELSLDPVKSFTDVLEICFKFNKKETAYHLIKKSISVPGAINQHVFEVCLNYNEDISIEILEYSINNENAKEGYMKVALLKKYFRLAIRLINFTVCKNFLSIAPPSDDKYFLLVQHLAMQAKKQKHTHLELEKNKSINKDYLKLVSSKSISDAEVFNDSIDYERKFLENKVESLKRSVLNSKADLPKIEKEIKAVREIIDERKSIYDNNNIQTFRAKTLAKKESDSKTTENLKKSRKSVQLPRKSKDDGVVKFNTHNKSVQSNFNANIEKIKTYQEHQKNKLNNLLSLNENKKYTTSEKRSQSSSTVGDKANKFNAANKNQIINSNNNDFLYFEKQRTLGSNLLQPLSINFSGKENELESIKKSKTVQKYKEKQSNNNQAIGDYDNSNIPIPNLNIEMKVETSNSNYPTSKLESIETNRLFMEVSNNIKSKNSSYYGISIKRKKSAEKTNKSITDNICAGSQEVNDKNKVNSCKNTNNLLHITSKDPNIISEKDDELNVSRRHSTQNISRSNIIMKQMSSSKHKGSSFSAQKKQKFNNNQNNSITNNPNSHKSSFVNSINQINKADKQDLKLLDEFNSYAQPMKHTLSNVSSNVSKHDVEDKYNSEERDVVTGIDQQNQKISKEMYSQSLKNLTIMSKSNKEVKEAKSSFKSEKSKEDDAQLSEAENNKLSQEEDFVINVQMIIVESLRSGEHVFYCLCLLLAIPDNLLNTDLSE